MTELFRNFFNAQVVDTLAERLHGAWPSFDRKSFHRAIVPKLGPLGLLQRCHLIRDELHAHLPADYPKAVSIVVRSLGPEIGAPDLSGDGGFLYMPLCAFVSKYGLEHFDLSLHALYELTKRFSSEFDIRAFLDRYPERTLARLRKWAHDPNPHVRRLVSEGSRPRLPWGTRLQRFIADPAPVLALLELLKQDEERYVIRSVANNLNDIAKDHPDLVVKTLQRWRKIDHPQTQWLVKHALRTLLKQGHPEALSILGYDPQAALELADLRVAPRTIRMGEAVTISFTLRSTAKKKQPAMIDYAMHHRKANGRTSPKVFKLTTKVLDAGAELPVTKRHSFKPIGIRPYYPGEHAVEVQVNGVARGKVTFVLTA